MSAPVIPQRVLQEQLAFRALLDGAARPGSIQTVTPLEGHGPFGGAIALMLAVLDHEVSFAVFPESWPVVETLLRLTGSFVAELEAADFILTAVPALPTVLARAKVGTPEYPDRGATVFVTVDALTPRAVPGALRLSGPGILGTTPLAIAGFDDGLIDAIAGWRVLLPQGVDLVCVEPGGSFSCLTRYTRVMKGED